jgi:GTPase SAR1 family protein
LDERRRSTPDSLDFGREAVRRRATVLLSGGTSSGKTTFLNALLRDVPRMSASCWSRTRPKSSSTDPTASASSPSKAKAYLHRSS